MTASVRISGLPNSSFLVGYPGVSATMPRIVGMVEVRPSVGVTAPVNVSSVTVALHRRESIHPFAESVTKKHLSASSRNNTDDLVGREELLYECPPYKEYEAFMILDIPFVIFIPCGRDTLASSSEDTLTPASAQLPSGTAETYYELVATVKQGPANSHEFRMPVPMVRYDTMSSFGMYNKPESFETVTDHAATLGVTLPRSSYGPGDSISVYVKLSPNLDWMSRSKKITIQKITVGIEERIDFRPKEGDLIQKVKALTRKTQTIGVKMPESGYFTHLYLQFPQRDLRDSDGLITRPKNEFPISETVSFTTKAKLYQISHFLTVKAHLSSAKDIVLRQPIVVSPFDHDTCLNQMEAIEQAARDASYLRWGGKHSLPSRSVRASDPDALRAINVIVLDGSRKRPILD